MSERIYLLGGDDVVCVSEDAKSLTQRKTTTVNEICRDIVYLFRKHGGVAEHIARLWVFDGMECEVLSPGENWRKGKITIDFRFIPNEPEPQEESSTPSEPPSPLDDLRAELNLDNQ